MLRTTAGFKRMPAVVGMAIFLQYWCAPPSAVTLGCNVARRRRPRAARFSFALIALTGCNRGGVAATWMVARRAELVRFSVKCVSLLFLRCATHTAQRTPTLHAFGPL